MLKLFARRPTAAAILFSGSLLLWSQEQRAPNSFDVASIKPNHSVDGSANYRFSPTHLEMANVPPSLLIELAFGLKSKAQLVGLPPWSRQEKFDIDAKVDVDAAKPLGKLAQEESRKRLEEMAQGLLATRFHMKTHWEKRELPSYFLVVANSGALLKLEEDSKDDKGLHTGFKTGPGEISATKCEVEVLISSLSGTPELAGRPVVDKTGLKGKYSWMLTWTPERMSAAATANGEAPHGLSLFTALQEQLGLQLKTEKSSVDVVVVDSIERPTEN